MFFPARADGLAVLPFMVKMLVIVLALFVPPVCFATPGYVRPDKLIMLWDYIDKKGDNLRPGKRIAQTGLDVILPTWFAIGSGKGNVTSLADKDYVKWAHDNGIKVWALFENRSDNTITFRALSDRNTRAKIIGQIAGFVRDYDLDGINIDFESMRPETGKFFEQFIAEMYAELKPLGSTLSVDLPLPAGVIRGKFDIGLIADNSDYIIGMGYDQYYSESRVIGPVAAIDWVKQGIEGALRYVPHEKFILGIPFYTRVWLENRESGRLQITSDLMGMKEAYEMFKKNSSIWQRDDDTKQIYAEFDRGDRTYKAWLEDEHSLSLKLDTINDYNLAGMCAWRSGWEWPEIWDMINAYFE